MVDLFPDSLLECKLRESKYFDLVFALTLFSKIVSPEYYALNKH